MKAAAALSASTALNEKRYLTIDEAAAYLSKSVNAIKHMQKRGTLPRYCYTHLGRSLRFLREELDALLRKDLEARAEIKAADRARGRRLSIVRRAHGANVTAEPETLSSQKIGERR